MIQKTTDMLQHSIVDLLDYLNSPNSTQAATVTFDELQRPGWCLLNKTTIRLITSVVFIAI